MLFNSIDFLIFFPVTCFIYFISPKKLSSLVLLVASFVFYASWNPYYLVLMLTSIGVTFFCGILIDNIYKKKITSRITPKIILNLSLVINLGILFFFKYYNFFIDSINTLTGADFIFINVILPVGISFYTFQAIGYTIDVYRKNVDAEKNILKYALFVSFFPQLVAGPIERSGNLLPQINAPRKFKYDNIINGCLTMSWGFFLKLVIADRLSVLVTSVYSNYQNYSGSMLLFATVLFAFQIYCDFYSYSTIAVGSAKVLGITLMENFKAPYLSTSIGAFWQRWHISLSGWFQDYIFTPLVWDNPFKKIPFVGKFFKNPPVIISVFIVFLVSGLWHGAAWTFVLWGLLHGVFRTIDICTKKSRKKLNKKLKINTGSFYHKSLSIIFTFFIVCLSYVFFRSDSVAQAFAIFNIMLTDFGTLSLSQIVSLGLNERELLVVLFSLVVLFVHDILYIKGIFIPQKGLLRYVLFYLFVILTLIFGVYGADYVAEPFIYFQF